MPLNFELGGKVYSPVTVTITADEIAAYAAASRDTNPQHQVGPDQIGSVVFPVVHGLPAIAVVSGDPELNLTNPLMIVHGEQEIVHHRPTRPGEQHVLTPSLVSVEDKGKGATYVSKVTTTTTDGELINEQFATMFVRGGGSGEARESAPRPTPPPRGETVATFVSHVDVGMPPEYAEASGDRNPIHVDEAVAKMVGLPGVINHGLGTLSLVAGGLVREVAGGDATRVRRLRVRFTEMVIPGSDLTTTVWKADEGVGFETLRPDGNAVMNGSLEIS